MRSEPAASSDPGTASPSPGTCSRANRHASPYPYPEAPIRCLRPSAPTLSILLTGSLIACAPEREPVTLDAALEGLSLDTFLLHMNELSGDRMAGRRPGTAGFDSAAAYVAARASDLGLEPGGANGTYLQPIRFRRSRAAAAPPSFSVAGRPLQPGADFSVSPRTSSAELEVRAPLVFVGFGISAPDLGYDDFDGLDVAGALVVVAGGAPDRFGSLERTVLSSSASRDAELRERGALGVVVIDEDESVSAAPRPRTRFLPPADADATAQDASGELAASVTVTASVARGWMRRVGRDLGDVLTRIRAGEPTSFDLEAEGQVRASFAHETFESPNVAALLPGTDPQLRDEHLVLTAHLDHLGIGAPVEGDSIYNGTLDNASGSAALLTLADALAEMAPPRRSVLFLWVTAEESGLLGSEYFARFPTVGEGRVVANQNIDGVMGMIAAATDVLAFGYEHSNLSEAVDFAVRRTGTPVSPDPTPEENLFIRSDQYAFVREGVPAIWVQAGRTSLDPAVDAQGELDRWIAERYHRPNDDSAQPVDVEGVRRELRSNLLVTWYIANEMEAVEWDPGSFLYRRWVQR